MIADSTNTDKRLLPSPALREAQSDEVLALRAQVAALEKQRGEAISVLQKMDRYVMENERLRKALQEAAEQLLRSATPFDRGCEIIRQELDRSAREPGPVEKVPEERGVDEWMKALLMPNAGGWWRVRWPNGIVEARYVRLMNDGRVSAFIDEDATGGRFIQRGYGEWLPLQPITQPCQPGGL